MITHTECLQLLRVELEEIVLLEAPAPVDADGARCVHAGALVKCEEILHGDDRHAGARGVCRLDEALAYRFRTIGGRTRHIRERLT